MFIGDKSGINEWSSSKAPQYAIDHVANSRYEIGHPKEGQLKNIFEFDFLDTLSLKLSNFFGISSDSIFFIDLGITKHVFLLFFVSFILVSTIISLVNSYISNKKNLPNKFMSLLEMIILYLRDDVLKNFIGDKEHREWAPLIYTIFFFVLFGNILGLIPLFDLAGLIGKLTHIDLLYMLSKGGHTATANINVTFAIATITFVAFIAAGIQKYGFVQHWKNLAPSGLPLPLYFIVVPIEFMGLFIRPLELTLRLAGNMMGGHIALIIFITFIFSIANAYGDAAGFSTAPFSIALALGLTMLELLVAVIQAYVFALLTAVFIGMAIHVDH